MILSPFLIVLNFQPPRIRMLGLPSSIAQCFVACAFRHVDLDVHVRIGPLECGDGAGDRQGLAVSNIANE